MENGVIFNLEKTDGDWFDFFESTIDLATGEIKYDDPKPGTGKACLRSARKLILEQTSKRKKTSEIVLNPKSRTMERIEYYKSQSAEEAQKDADDRIDYMITDLKDFFDGKKKPIECTRENKILLAKVPVFDRFLARCMELQLNASAVQTEKEGKNLSKP